MPTLFFRGKIIVNLKLAQSLGQLCKDVMAIFALWLSMFGSMAGVLLHTSRVDQVFSGNGDYRSCPVCFDKGSI